MHLSSEQTISRPKKNARYDRYRHENNLSGRTECRQQLGKDRKKEVTSPNKIHTVTFRIANGRKEAGDSKLVRATDETAMSQLTAEQFRQEPEGRAAAGAAASFSLSPSIPKGRQVPSDTVHSNPSDVTAPLCITLQLTVEKLP
jgi:hypothetical protein